MSFPGKLAIRSEQFPDRQQNQAQTNGQAAAKALNRIPFASGAPLGPTAFTAGQTIALAHPLGYVPHGIFPIDAYGGYVSWKRDQSATGSTATTIAVTCENAGTYTFWVW